MHTNDLHAHNKHVYLLNEYNIYLNFSYINILQFITFIDKKKLILTHEYAFEFLEKA